MRHQYPTIIHRHRIDFTLLLLKKGTKFIEICNKARRMCQLEWLCSRASSCNSIINLVERAEGNAEDTFSMELNLQLSLCAAAVVVVISL